MRNVTALKNQGLSYDSVEPRSASPGPPVAHSSSSSASVPSSASYQVTTMSSCLPTYVQSTLTNQQQCIISSVMLTGSGNKPASPVQQQVVGPVNRSLYASSRMSLMVGNPLAKPSSQANCNTASFGNAKYLWIDPLGRMVSPPPADFADEDTDQEGRGKVLRGKRLDVKDNENNLFQSRNSSCDVPKSEYGPPSLGSNAHTSDLAGPFWNAANRISLGKISLPGKDFAEAPSVTEMAKRCLVGDSAAGIGNRNSSQPSMLETHKITTQPHNSMKGPLSGVDQFKGKVRKVRSNSKQHFCFVSFCIPPLNQKTQV